VFVSHELALLVTGFTELLGRWWIGNAFTKVFDESVTALGL
jgi:hypothetical protein